MKTTATATTTEKQKVDRTALTDDSGRWFDRNKATVYRENTWWNGNNHISRATGSQWEHEAIYRTAGGIYILETWSNYQGTPNTYTQITKETAAEWFVKNEYQDEDLPEEFAKEVKDLEIE